MSHYFVFTLTTGVVFFIETLCKYHFTLVKKYSTIILSAKGSFFRTLGQGQRARYGQVWPAPYLNSAQ
jgi:hypothetical protein